MSTHRQLLDNVLEDINRKERLQFAYKALQMSQILESDLQIATKVVVALDAYAGTPHYTNASRFLIANSKTGTKEGFNAAADVMLIYSRIGFEGLVPTLNRMIDAKRPPGLAERITDRYLVDKIKLYKDHESIEEIIFGFGKMAIENSTTILHERADYFVNERIKGALFKYNKKVNSAILKIIFNVPNDIFELLDLFNKYDKHKETIAKYVADKELFTVHLDELVTDRAYKEIAKNGTKIHDILVKPYGLFREDITDTQVKENISYYDLDFVIDTHNIVMNMHEKRYYLAQNAISECYVKELNRAISQGDDYDSKIKNLKQYCKEVKQRIKESAEELMFYA